jgi:hypothetical protein
VKSAGQLKGTNTNDNAVTGYVGEYIENNRSTDTPAITSNTWTSIDTGNATFNDTNEVGITLTPGDWDIAGHATFTRTGVVTVTRLGLLIGTAKGTSTTGSNASKQGYAAFGTSLITNGNDATTNTGVFRVSISATTTYYLKAIVVWSGGTSVTAVGNIYARRVR